MTSLPSVHHGMISHSMPQKSYTSIMDPEVANFQRKWAKLGYAIEDAAHDGPDAVIAVLNASPSFTRAPGMEYAIMLGVLGQWQAADWDAALAYIKANAEEAKRCQEKRVYADDGQEGGRCEYVDTVMGWSNRFHDGMGSCGHGYGFRFMPVPEVPQWHPHMEHSAKEGWTRGVGGIWKNKPSVNPNGFLDRMNAWTHWWSGQSDDLWEHLPRLGATHTRAGAFINLCWGDLSTATRWLCAQNNRVISTIIQSTIPATEQKDGRDGRVKSPFGEFLFKQMLCNLPLGKPYRRVDWSVTLSGMKSLGALPCRQEVSFPLRYLIEHAAGANDMPYYHDQLHAYGLNFSPEVWANAVIAAESWAGWCWAVSVWGKATMREIGRKLLLEMASQEKGLPEDELFSKRWLRWLRVSYQTSDLPSKMKGEMLKQGMSDVPLEELSQEELHFLLRSKLFSPLHRQEFAMTMIRLHKAGIKLSRPLIESDDEWDNGHVDMAVDDFVSKMPRVWKAMIDAWLCMDLDFVTRLSGMNRTYFADCLRKHQLRLMEQEVVKSMKEASLLRPHAPPTAIAPLSASRSKRKV